MHADDRDAARAFERRVAAHEMAAGDVADLVGEYLADAPARIEDLLRSYSVGDEDGLGRAAHTLKSSSAYMGALGLAEICREIEEAARRHESSDLEERLQRTRSEFERVCTALRRLVD